MQGFFVSDEAGRAFSVVISDQAVCGCRSAENHLDLVPASVCRQGGLFILYFKRHDSGNILVGLILYINTESLFTAGFERYSLIVEERFTRSALVISFSFHEEVNIPALFTTVTVIQNVTGLKHPEQR